MAKSVLLLPTVKPVTIQEILDAELEKANSYVDKYLEPSNFLFSAENDEYFLMHKGTKAVCKLGPTAIKHILEKFGYTKKLIETLSPDIVQASINQLIEKSPLRNKKHLFRLEKNGDTPIIRAILSDNYSRFDNVHLLGTIIDVIKDVDDWDVIKHDISDETFEIRLTKKITNTLKVGDPAKFGLHFTNSEVGLRSVEAQLCLYICRCTNGLLSVEQADSFNIKHFGNNNHKPDESLRKLLNHSGDSWNNLMNNYNNSEMIQIQNPLKFLEKASAHYQLSKRTSEYVEENFRKTLNLFDDTAPLRDISDSFTESSWQKFSMRDADYKLLEFAGSEILTTYNRFLSSDN